MNAPQQVLLVGLSPESGAALSAQLGGEASCRVLPHPPRPAEPLGCRPAAAVVVAGADSAAAFAFVARLAGEGVRSVVAGPDKDADLILHAMRAGAAEFALAADVEHLARAVRELIRPQGAALGTVVSVFAPKGGVGATTLAVNLAGALEKRGDRTCLVDLELEMGDVLSFLDLSGSYGVSDVIANLHRLDRELLDASLPRHRSGIRVLAQSNNIEEAACVDASGVGRLLDFLRRHYDRVVVDGLRGFGEPSLAALDASQCILLVVTQEIPAIRNARRCVELFQRLGYGDDRVRMVVNRHQRRARIPDELLVETAGLPISARISSDYQLVDRAVHAGALIADKAGHSSLAHDLARLVDMVVEKGPPPERAGSLLRRMFSGKEAVHGAQ